MKIRMKGASLRLRLSRPDVEALIREGGISETTPFPKGSLEYRLRRSAQGDAVDASFESGIIAISLPAALVAGWDTDDRIGFRAQIPLPDGGSLLVLVEKDFQCLDDTNEDQSENYPNPKTC